MKKIVLSLAVAVALVGVALLSGAVPRPGRNGGGPVGGGAGGGGISVVTGGALMLESSLGNTHLVRGSDGMLYLNLLLKARDAAAEDADRLPLDLVLVIDRSGSMGDAGKLEYAKAAAATVVDHLGPADRLGIVIYDDAVETLAPLAPVENRAALKARIASVAPRASTDLAGGLARGLDLLPTPEGRRLARVILLSDGLANRGVTDPAEIARISERGRERGVRVTSLGLGAEFNEDLMLRIAQSGGGTYRFIESPTQMASLFENEVGAVRMTVARNVVVRVDPAVGATVADIFGHPFDRSGASAVVAVPDLSGGEVHSLTVRLSVPTDAIGPRAVAAVRVTYEDALSAKPGTLTASLGATCTEDASLVARNERKDVAREALEDEAARELDQVARTYESGDKDAADAKLGGMIQKLEAESRRLNAPALAGQAKALKGVQSSFAASPPASAAGKVLIKKAKEDSYKRQMQQAQ